MDIIYRSIVKQLTDQVSGLNWIDLDGGQLEAPDESYPVQFPAAFIDFENMQYQTLQRGMQQGIATITVRVAFDIYEGFYGTAPDLKQAADRLQLLNDVYKAIHRFSGRILPVEVNGEVTGYEDSHFSNLLRQSLTTERRDDGLKVYRITFQCAVRDPHDLPAGYVQHTLEDINVTKQDQQ
ncbi:MAG: hypothetical protein JXA03_15475 [Bacteroidales bacterium]|nr:hypothetical protein [Bacteroidales bacterium]